MSSSGQSGPPAPIKAILSKFSSGKEEDKISGYLKMLKVGPDLLKYIPGEKVGDLRCWLESYRFWNQGGMDNVKSMLQVITQKYLSDNPPKDKATLTTIESLPMPRLQVTPDIGLLHPLLSNEDGGIKYAMNPKECESIDFVMHVFSTQC